MYNGLIGRFAQGNGCWYVALSGIGRTGIILTAYLMYKGEAMHDALNMAFKIGSEPQTREQFDILEEFSLRQKDTGTEKQKTT